MIGSSLFLADVCHYFLERRDGKGFSWQQESESCFEVL